MIRILGRRWPLAKVVLYPAQVQGQGAAEIARALALAFRSDAVKFRQNGMKVMSRRRSTGARWSRLWAFNEEVCV